MQRPNRNRASRPQRKIQTQLPRKPKNKQTPQRDREAQAPEASHERKGDEASVVGLRGWAEEGELVEGWDAGDEHEADAGAAEGCGLDDVVFVGAEGGGEVGDLDGCVRM